MASRRVGERIKGLGNYPKSHRFKEKKSQTLPKYGVPHIWIWWFKKSEKTCNVIYGWPLVGRGSPSKGQIITQKATDEERRKAKQPLYGKCFLTKQVIWNVRQISNIKKIE